MADYGLVESFFGAKSDDSPFIIYRTTTKLFDEIEDGLRKAERNCANITDASLSIGRLRFYNSQEMDTTVSYQDAVFLVGVYMKILKQQYRSISAQDFERYVNIVSIWNPDYPIEDDFDNTSIMQNPKSLRNFLLEMNRVLNTVLSSCNVK